VCHVTYHATHAAPAGEGNAAHCLVQTTWKSKVGGKKTGSPSVTWVVSFATGGSFGVALASWLCVMDFSCLRTPAPGQLHLSQVAAVTLALLIHCLCLSGTSDLHFACCLHPALPSALWSPHPRACLGRLRPVKWHAAFCSFPVLFSTILVASIPLPLPPRQPLRPSPSRPLTHTCEAPEALTRSAGRW
jgi:hypothetical protein